MMATQPQPFIASAPATRIARVANTNLFALAASYFGNALYWTAIAQSNKITDPWIMGQANILIPAQPPTSTVTPTGVLGA